jgi:ATP-binding cassette, subfamily B, bacterial IrtB/YbtQ
LVTSFLTPATVVLLMYLFDWRLALAATLTMPVILVVYRWSSGLSRKADEVRAESQADTGGRVIEFAQLQPVLRVFGRGRGGQGLLDRSLHSQYEASRRY